MYPRGRRRQRRKKVVGGLIVVVVAVLIGTWPASRHAGRPNEADLLTGRLAANTGPPALKLLVPPAQGTPKKAISSPETKSRPAGTSSPAADNKPVAPPATRPAQETAVGYPSPPGSQPATGPLVPLDAAKAADELRAGLDAKQNNRPLEARDRLNRALHSNLSPSDTKLARQALDEVANVTLFTKVYLRGDPLVDWHTIHPGDTIGKLAKQASVSEELVVQVNDLRNKNFIREGQRIKVLRGPFHVAIHKHDHDMYIYLQNVYVRTVRVALGEQGSTPEGRWKVANHLENPAWTDPRSGKRWHPDDPGNPIGEYWIGIEGIEGAALGQFGYGIHGTIEPQSIGQDVSMGCIRLTPDDIAFVYKLLVPGQSYVTISE